MVFSSITFILIFLPVSMLVYLGSWLIFPDRFKFKILNIILLLLSLTFYAWGEPSYIVLLIVSVFLNYFFALAIEVNRGQMNAFVWLWIGIITDVLFLIFFKYINFLLSIHIFGSLVSSLPEAVRPAPNFYVALPLGISFYTFQAISYLIDIYRNTAKVSRSLVNFGCYLTMFPQLVAGPIVRYSTIEKELIRRSISVANISDGTEKFIYGLAKKILIADTCGQVADAAFSVPNAEVSFIVAWAGMICYSLQIYFDFSGYSDMAIGLGKIFGFSFPENFNYPYISRSIKEFWRRWHISLSSWFRDYLYIPLGGNRKGRIITYFNLMFIFCLCGFWHGADWVFLLWGIYHGIFLVLERIFKHFFDNLPHLIGHIYTISVFMIGWLLFRSDSVDQFLSFLKGLINCNPLTPQTFKVCIKLFAYNVYIALILGILLSAPVYPAIINKLQSQAGNRLTEKAVLSCRYLWTLLLLLLCLMPLYGSTYNAFIYFRF